MASVFGDGSGDYNREVKAAGDWALFELGQGAIGRRFEGLQDTYAPMLAQMSQASQIGANMDTQSMQANLARQGLGGSGLGTALGAGLRTGATFQTNQLRARLAAEAMQQAIGLQQNTASMIMARATGQVPEQGWGAQTMDRALQAAGVGMQAYSLGKGG
jgi:hypothetical protein